MKESLSPVLPGLLAALNVFRNTPTGGLLCLMAMWVFDGLFRYSMSFLRDEVRPVPEEVLALSLL